MYISIKLAEQTITDLEESKKTLYNDYKFISVGTEISYAINQILLPYWSRIDWDKYKFDKITDKKSHKAVIPKRINMEATALKKIDELKCKESVSTTEVISMILTAACEYKAGRLQVIEDFISEEYFEKNIKINIELFKHSILEAAFPAVYGISLDFKDKDIQPILLYVGQSNNPIRRAGEHIGHFLEAPDYFGLTDLQLANSSLIIRFSIMKRLGLQSSEKERKEYELECIRDNKPITQRSSILSASDSMLEANEKCKIVQKELINRKMVCL